MKIVLFAASIPIVVTLVGFFTSWWVDDVIGMGDDKVNKND